MTTHRSVRVEVDLSAGPIDLSCSEEATLDFARRVPASCRWGGAGSQVRSVRADHRPEGLRAGRRRRAGGTEGVHALWEAAGAWPSGGAPGREDDPDQSGEGASRRWPRCSPGVRPGLVRVGGEEAITDLAEGTLRSETPIQRCLFHLVTSLRRSRCEKGL